MQKIYKDNILALFDQLHFPDLDEYAYFYLTKEFNIGHHSSGFKKRRELMLDLYKTATDKRNTSLANTVLTEFLHHMEDFGVNIDQVEISPIIVYFSFSRGNKLVSTGRYKNTCLTKSIHELDMDLFVRFKMSKSDKMRYVLSGLTKLNLTAEPGEVYKKEYWNIYSTEVFTYKKPPTRSLVVQYPYVPLVTFAYSIAKSSRMDPVAYNLLNHGKVPK